MDVKLLSCRLVLPLVSCVLTTCVMPASVSHASGMGGTESTSDGGGVIPLMLVMSSRPLVQVVATGVAAVE